MKKNESCKKHNNVLARVLFAAALIAALAFTACEQPSNTVTVTPVPGDVITYTAAQSGGVDGVTDSNGITFTFSESIDSLKLTAADITVGGTATKGTAELSGSGINWTLPITVNAAGHTTVQITKTGIEAEIKNITVYKAGQIAPTLTGITAVYSGTAVIYPETPLDDLKTDLTVTAAYSNGTTQTVTDYALSGTLAVGTSTITVTYEGETTTFTVTVTAAGSTEPTLTGITAVYNGKEPIFRNTPLDDLKTGLTVTAAYSNGTNQTVTDYMLSGTLAVGTSTITVTYEGKTTTFNVTVAVDPEVVAIDNLYLYLGGKTVNTPDTPYLIAINGITDANAGTTFGPGGIRDKILQYRYNEDDPSYARYVYIDISGNDITALPASAFSSLNNLIGIRLPNSITSIGGSAFSNCTSLASVTIPDSVSSIGTMAFDGCTSLASVTIPNNVTSIGTLAFYGCSSLASVTISNNVTSIGNGAFQRCTSLTSVTIPNSVTTIGRNAFSNCTSLTSVTFAGNIPVESGPSSNLTGFSSTAFGTEWDLYSKYFAVSGGGAGAYTRPDTTSSTWTKQP